MPKAIIRKSETHYATIANRYSSKQQDNDAQKWMIAIQNDAKYFHKLLSKLFIRKRTADMSKITN